MSHKPIPRAVRWLPCLLLPLAGGAYGQSCSPVAGSATAIVTDVFGGNVDVQGTVTFSCTRPRGNPRFPSTFWIGVSGTNGSRTLASGASTLNFQLFTNFAGCSTAWQGTTGVTVANALTGNGDQALSNVTGTFCLRIPTGQATARPLTFNGSATLTVRSTNSAGYNWGSGTLSLSATVNPRCFFSSPPGALLMNYTSFQTSAATGTASFDIRCTNTTPYSLALDATTGSVLGLNYSVALTGSSAVGTGLAQSYQVNGSIAANQSGTCAVGAGCTGSQTRTVTVSY